MAVNKTNEYCAKANERLQRAAHLLQQVDELKDSITKMQVSIPPPTSTTLPIQEQKNKSKISGTKE